MPRRKLLLDSGARGTRPKHIAQLRAGGSVIQSVTFTSGCSGGNYPSGAGVRYGACPVDESDGRRRQVASTPSHRAKGRARARTWAADAAGACRRRRRGLSRWRNSAALPWSSGPVHSLAVKSVEVFHFSADNHLKIRCVLMSGFSTECEECVFAGRRLLLAKAICDTVGPRHSCTERPSELRCGCKCWHCRPRSHFVR